MLRSDFHTHTTLCDGENSPEEMAEEALKRGMRHLGFSGHMDPDIHMDMDQYVRRIKVLQEEYRDRLDILLGVELDTMYDPRAGQRAEYVIGSTHFPDVPCNRGCRGLPRASESLSAGRLTGPLPHPDGPLATGRPTGPLPPSEEGPLSVDMSPGHLQLLADTYFGGDFYKLARCYYETEAQVYDRLKCTFVGHFDLVVRFNDQMQVLDESDRRYLDPALSAMEYLVREGVPFEINCGAVNRGRKKEVYPNPILLRRLHEMGGEILISSDAHRKDLLLGGFDKAVRTALSCGFTHTNLLVHGRDGSVQWRQVALDSL